MSAAGGRRGVSGCVCVCSGGRPAAPEEPLQYSNSRIRSRPAPRHYARPLADRVLASACSWLFPWWSCRCPMVAVCLLVQSIKGHLRHRCSRARAAIVVHVWVGVCVSEAQSCLGVCGWVCVSEAESCLGVCGWVCVSRAAANFYPYLTHVSRVCTKRWRLVPSRPHAVP